MSFYGDTLRIEAFPRTTDAFFHPVGATVEKGGMTLGRFLGHSPRGKSRTQRCRGPKQVGSPDRVI